MKNKNNIYAIVASVLVCVTAVVLLACIIGDEKGVSKNRDESVYEEAVYLVYVENHPELTIKYIEYNGIKRSHIAYNVGTGVLYVVSSDGDIEPLHNADGTLMLYSEDDGVIAVTK